MQMEKAIQQATIKRAIKGYKAFTGKKNDEVASELGLSWSGLKQILYQKGYKTSFGTLEKIAKLCGLPVTEFIVNSGSATPTNVDDDILVPWFDVRPSAGNGTPDATDTQATRGMMFNRRWLRNFLNVTPENAALFNIEGDSMEPKLRTGDLIIVDKGAVETGFRDGIWMLRIGNDIAVKQVQKVAPTEYQAVSINTIYPPIALNDDNWELIGRVVYRGERL